MKIISIIFLNILFYNHISNASAFSKYYGYLYHDTLNSKQKVQLEFVTFRNENKKLKIHAFLKIYFGEDNSHEYLTYHYNNVYYNVLENTLLFSERDQNISFNTSKFKNGEIVAKAHSSTHGYIGELKLQQQKNHDINELGSITGTYKSLCKNKKRRLHLYAYRNDEGFSSLGEPFYSYSITGQMSEAGSFSCSKNQFCITEHFNSGNYNFFDASLSLSSNRNIVDCTIKNHSSIQCGPCLYKKETPDIKQKKINQNLVTHKKNNKHIQISDGIYSGELILNGNNIHKNLSLNIHSFQDQSASFLSINSLFFISSQKNEAISFKFQKKTTQAIQKSLFFENSAANPFMIHITHLHNNKIEGHLYNKFYGDYGKFSLQKNSISLIKDRPSLEGFFQSEKYDMELGTLKKDSILNSSNPFNPYTFYGSIVYKSKFRHRTISITGGSFDIQTGWIALELDNNTRVASGFIDEDQNTIILKMMSKGIGTLDQNEKNITFRRKIDL
ncbi:MAG: hypothetical protein AB8C84_01250 [Oligoflexales bacterium]